MNIQFRKKTRVNSNNFGGGFSSNSAGNIDVNNLKYVPCDRVVDDVNWLVPDRKIKSDLGFVGNLEGNATTADEALHAQESDNSGLLNHRADYYNPSNCNSFLTPWRASTMSANYYNCQGHQALGGTPTSLDVGNGDQTLTLYSKVSPKTWFGGNVYDIYHSGNINKPDVDFVCNDLIANNGQFNNLKVLGNLDVYELTANQTRVTNGDLWIQNSYKLTNMYYDSATEFSFDIDYHSLKVDDLCIIQVKRKSGTVSRVAFKVVGYDISFPIPYQAVLISGSIVDNSYNYLFFDGDLVVQVGNTTNTARQSSVLNCVSFGGYGAATLYYANVDTIPVGSFYPDNSKITSAIGDLRAIGYGAAATYTTDGKFKGNVEANSGKFGNFSIKEDNISAEYITMSDGLLPTVASLDLGEVVVSTYVTNQASQNTYVECTAERTIDVSVDSTLLCGYVAGDTVSGWTSFTMQSGNSFRYDYSKVLIYKIEGASQTLVYSQDLAVNDIATEGVQVKVNLVSGKYKMMTTARVSVDAGGGTLECNLNGYQLRPIQSMNYLGRNGMMSYFGKRNYLRFTSDDDFTIRKGEYMLRISETSGIQKSTNGGGSWQNI